MAAISLPSPMASLRTRVPRLLVALLAVLLVGCSAAAAGLNSFQSPDGRYAFPDVPLDPGSNEFLLVFHGPLGQRREERLSVLSEPGLGSGGFLRYRTTCEDIVNKGYAGFIVGRESASQTDK